MVQVQILSGIYASTTPEVRVAYPVNLVPVAEENGVSAGYLRPADALIESHATLGVCRGLYFWDGTLYAVTGTTLISIPESGAIVSLGTVADGGPVSWAQGFDRLGIASGGFLYYWDGSSLVTVTDPDVGVVIDVVWIDGYWMVTDGEFLAVSDLTDPTQFNPLKYGSSEASPDPVIALQRLRNEVYALNRFTIEVFDNVGGLGFPFQRIEGAQLQKGCIGTHACCVFGGEAIAFVGSGQNEAPGVYLGGNGGLRKVSDNEIDRVLAEVGEVGLADTVCEYRNDDGAQRLYIHLPDRTLVFDAVASGSFGRPVWYVLTAGLDGFSQYPARFFTWAFNRWNVGDPAATRVGYASREASSSTINGAIYGQPARWEFSTPIIYNDTRGVAVKSLELVALTGSAPINTNPTIGTSYSRDGVTWSQELFVSAGTRGERSKRLCWFRQGAFRQRRIQRFRGDTSAHVSFLRLEADLEGMAW